MDFVLEEIKHVLKLVDPHNPNVDLVKIQQATMAQQSIDVVIRESLEESRSSWSRETSVSKLPKKYSMSSRQVVDFCSALAREVSRKDQFLLLYYSCN